MDHAGTLLQNSCGAVSGPYAQRRWMLCTSAILLLLLLLLLLSSSSAATVACHNESRALDACVTMHATGAST